MSYNDTHREKKPFFSLKKKEKKRGGGRGAGGGRPDRADSNFIKTRRRLLQRGAAAKGHGFLQRAAASRTKSFPEKSKLRQRTMVGGGGVRRWAGGGGSGHKPLRHSSSCYSYKQSSILRNYSQIFLVFPRLPGIKTNIHICLFVPQIDLILRIWGEAI